MKFIGLFLVLIAFAVAPGNGNRRSFKRTRGPKVAGCYGVVFKEGASPDNVKNVKRIVGGQKDINWRKGFQVCSTSEQRLQRVLDEFEDVAEVFEDGMVFKVESTTLWGLDRIDSTDGQRDGFYTSPGNQGAGVTVYVLDTCLDDTHADFGGRAERLNAADQYPGDAFTASCCDHGTHCSGTVGSTTYGVAKQATIKGIRVLSCAGSGSYTGIIAGIDWVVANHNFGSGPAIISMSLGGSGTSTAIENAINDAKAAGVITVVAAGNSNVDACGYQPAFVPSAVTVGASTISDTAAGFSNYGSCVDIWAPGADICSTYPGQSSACWSGTSMACPHVAGGLAVLWSNNPTMTADEIEAFMYTKATGDIVKAGTTDLLLNVADFGVLCDDAGCQACPTDVSICEACFDGYALTGTTCAPCTVADCATCPAAAATCTSCSEPFSLISNVCETCITGCLSCSTVTTCDVCDTGYRVGAGGVCEPCSDPRGLCEQCDGNADVCEVCADGGVVAANGECCAPGCASCSSEAVCTACSGNGYITNGLCVEYCELAATSSLDSMITSIVVTSGGVTMNIDSSSCGTYRKASQTIEMNPGDPFDLTITRGTCGGDYNKKTYAYIDFNGDREFDASELVMNTGAATTTNTDSVTGFTFPNTGANGKVRARIVTYETSSTTAPACGSFTYGEVVDFDIIIDNCQANVDCDDGNACTTDTCDIASGVCTNSVNTGAACSDGTECTTGETCSASGECGSPTSTVSCSAGTQCTINVCNPSSGTCEVENLLGFCDDGNACTIEDTCDAGTCSAGVLATCTNGVAVTDGSCCDCNVGYQYFSSSGNCVDINECLASPCASNEVCINSEGSYTCALQEYCAQAISSTADTLVSQVSIVGMYTSPLSTACTSGTKWGNIGVTLVPGQTYSMSVGLSSCGGQYTKQARVWIDMNRDADFTADEVIYTSPSTSSPNREETFSFTVPTGMPPGDRGLRVSVIETSGAIDPCGSYTWGEAEDFMITFESECTDNTDCDDSNECTDDVCTAGSCTNTNNAASCDDGSVCTTSDVCSNGSCGGTTVDCGTDDQCTTYSCDAVSGCQTDYSTGPCNDGDSCTYDDTCSSGTCSGSVPTCTGGTLVSNCCTCTLPLVFDDTTGNCALPPYCDSCAQFTQDTLITEVSLAGMTQTSGSVGADCSDFTNTPGAGITLDQARSYQLVVKTGTASAFFTAHVQAFIDFNGDHVYQTSERVMSLAAPAEANTLSAIFAVPDDAAVGTYQMRVVIDEAGPKEPCSAYNYGETEDYSVTIVAYGGCSAASDCAALNACRSGVCNTDNVCEFAAELSCDDSNPCTNDSCNPSSGCVNDADTSNTCSGSDALCTTYTCQIDGSCGESAVTCPDASNECLDSVCTPGTGCQEVPNSAACDDGNACTDSDQCSAGTCSGSNVVLGSGSCASDGDPCTSDTCDGNGSCYHPAATGTSCNDGDACTTADQCDGAGTCAGTADPSCCSSDADCASGQSCIGGSCVASPNCESGTCWYIGSRGGSESGLSCQQLCSNRNLVPDLAGGDAAKYSTSECLSAYYLAIAGKSGEDTSITEARYRNRRAYGCHYRDNRSELRAGRQGSSYDPTLPSRGSERLICACQPSGSSSSIADKEPAPAPAPTRGNRGNNKSVGGSSLLGGLAVGTILVSALAISKRRSAAALPPAEVEMTSEEISIENVESNPEIQSAILQVLDQVDEVDF